MKTFIKITISIIFVIILFTFTINKTSEIKDDISFRGFTMGTFYEVKLINDSSAPNIKSEILKEKIDLILKNYNLIVSPFEPNSEISRFNKSKTTEPFKISKDFYKIIKYSYEISNASAGAYDPTIAPLINLWGFGTKNKTKQPSKYEIIKAKNITGFTKIKTLPNLKIIKTNPNITLNLSAIAKGYGVDLIAKYLQSKGFKNGFVNIGGEIVTFGSKKDDTLWNIAIETPDYGGAMNGYFKTIKLKDKAIATSGDYRNYFKNQGKVFSHIINPKTGYPVDNKIASVTVIANNCMQADVIATTITVLGTKQGLEFVENIKNCEALIIQRNNDKTYTQQISTGFKQNYLK